MSFIRTWLKLLPESKFTSNATTVVQEQRLLLDICTRTARSYLIQVLVLPPELPILFLCHNVC